MLCVLIRPALTRLQKEFGREYVLVAPELATDGIDVLFSTSRERPTDIRNTLRSDIANPPKWFWTLAGRSGNRSSREPGLV
jgi:mitochondrial fission protein ELM1